MKCRDVLPLLSRFLDGELDSRQMRAVALHTTRCSQCETELRQLERLEDIIVEQVTRRAEEVDLAGMWTGIASRLEEVSPPWFARLRGWLDFSGLAFSWRPPAYAAAVALLVLIVFLLQPSAPRSEQIAAANLVDNSAILDSVESHVDSIALLSEPETNTMVLWVNDDVVAAGEIP
jgi:anti-sigma factor RsiW